MTRCFVLPLIQQISRIVSVVLPYVVLVLIVEAWWSGFCRIDRLWHPRPGEEGGPPSAKHDVELLSLLGLHQLPADVCHVVRLDVRLVQFLIDVMVTLPEPAKRLQMGEGGE